MADRRGQVTVETFLLAALAVTALVAMSLYLQRGYQGYLYANTAVQGTQFDPTQPSSDTQTLNNYTVSQESTTALQGGSQSSARLPRGLCRGDEMCLPDMAGGTMTGRVLRSAVTSVANWDVSRDATYEAQ